MDTFSSSQSFKLDINVLFLSLSIFPFLLLNLPPPSQPFTMLVSGVVDAAVAGGIENYRKAFFTPGYLKTNPGHQQHVQVLLLFLFFFLLLLLLFYSYYFLISLILIKLYYSKYQFLTPSFQKLKLLLKEHLRILEVALKTHGQHCPFNLQGLQDHLETQLVSLKQSLQAF